MRSEFVSQLVHSFGAVLFKRAGISLGFWGEPGIGKTFTTQAVLRDISCHHLSLHATTPAASIVRALPRPKKLPAWAERQLERLENGEPLESDVEATGLAALLAGLAPFVLSLEDLHEASPQRQAVIVQLAQTINRTRGVGLIVTSRTQPPDGFKAYRLGWLEDAESQAILERELGAPLPAVGLEWIQFRTRGNPLFALEFLRYLIRQGFLWSDGQRWNWRHPVSGFVPVTVEALIVQLTSNLTTTPEVRAVLAARAILPVELEAEHLEHIWAEVAAVDRVRLEAIRLDLERGGLMRGTRFAHPLFAEVIAQELTIIERQQCSRRAIAALEGHDPILAVSLISNAGFSRVEALSVLHRAIGQARQTGSAQLAPLLGLAVEQAVGEERVRLVLEAEALLRPTRSYQQIARLTRLALDEQGENRELRWRLSDACAWLGQTTEVEALVSELPETERWQTRWWDVRFRSLARASQSNEALTIWRQQPDLADLPQALTYAVSMYANLGEFETAEGLIVRGLEMDGVPLGMRVNLMGTLAFIRSEQGRLEEADHLHERCIGLGAGVDDFANRAVVHYNRSFNQYRLGRYENAILDLERAVALYGRAGSAYYSANALTVLGAMLSRLGRFERAETVLLEALDTLSRIGLTHGLANNAWEIATLYAEWRPAHGGVLALKFARDAVEHSRGLANKRCLTTALTVAARVEAWQGKPVQALALAQEAFEHHSSDSIDDRAQCAFALAWALEANDHTGQALEQWVNGTRDAPLPEFQNEAALEIARLEGDFGRAQELAAWFDQVGLGALAVRARCYFPNLNRQPEPSATNEPRSRIKVLGPIQLERDGQVIPTRAHKRLEIIAYLLETRIAGKSEVSTLDLLDTFYPDGTEDQAKNTLKQHVHQIRTSLGSECLHSTPNGYALGAVSSDAEDFLNTGDPSLWRGAYLEGFSEGWISSVRAALSLALHSSVEGLIESALIGSAPSGAVRLGRILCEMEPYEPQALRLTLRAMRASGDHRAASSLFHEHRRRFELNELLPASLEAFLEIPNKTIPS